MSRTTCSSCGVALVEMGPCPACGCEDRHIEVQDTVAVLESLGVKARHGVPGEVKPFLESSSQVKWKSDRQRVERRRLIVDRETMHYVQEWSDLETGEVTFRKEGRLDDPKLHGESARRPTRGKPGP